MLLLHFEWREGGEQDGKDILYTCRCAKDSPVCPVLQSLPFDGLFNPFTFYVIFI